MYSSALETSRVDRSIAGRCTASKNGLESPQGEASAKGVNISTEIASKVQKKCKLGGSK